MKRALLSAALGALVFVGATAAAEPRRPLPCEWYPVDPSDPSGEWYQPLPDPDCEAPFEQAPAKPRHNAVRTFPAVTLPPTDTIR